MGANEIMKVVFFNFLFGFIGIDMICNITPIPKAMPIACEQTVTSPFLQKEEALHQLSTHGPAKGNLTC